ncbi:hypothetical protein L202_01971 [Cryptococcus amylolentus CBS 6039]|uniref:PCI domain-containing protein n=2 Tax=Cryptococcus amylolentus TaxID=104669 RepID=A0A1E3HYX2_9TREE|nr:hypothetical protein L202_01971 [Cryptococcus amylolentus CBS 6039]ODN81553.1 hypothetical protein L202_01971 [Cryptococcus amylolentus CBS 6039]ODO10219.1 hypothetical protein I350_02448 [Cryptococcus amylolentus CBS 6273]
MSDPAAALEPFLILVRSTKGAAAAKVILDATAAPGVYVFGELLDAPNVQQLAAEPSFEGHIELLRLFAYGTLSDYEKNKSSFPELKEAHLHKLKQLTLVALALQHRSLSYDHISSALQLESIRQVEDTVIDTIYAGLLTGKLHHDQKVLHIDSVSGRDVRPKDLEQLQQGLANWCQTAQTLLSALDNQINTLRTASANEASHNLAYKIHRNEAYRNVQAELAHEKASGGFAGAASREKILGGFGSGRGAEHGWEGLGGGERLGGKQDAGVSGFLSNLQNVGNLGGAFTSGRKWVRSD